MKVRRSSVSSHGNKDSLPGTSSARSDQKVEQTFAASLKTIDREIVSGDLKALLDSIRQIGDVFLRSPDEKKLNSYKDAVGTYLKRVSKELFSLRNEPGVMENGKQKVYQLVETVQAEIDNLTRETLQKDKALSFLASLDDIKGLVMDLLS